MDYEAGAKHLDELIAWAEDNPGDRNEATTRLHLIDRLLVDVLGWPLDEVETERYDRGDYTDYELGGDRRVLLVEAKREGVVFELPAGFDKPTCRLATLKELSEPVWKAVLQAMQYGQSRGIGVAAVSNGHQIVAFLASRQDGTPPEDGRALVFDSLRSMRVRFKDLWNALSPSGLAARGLLPLIGSSDSDPPPQKLSGRIVEYPGYKNRNPAAAELQILGGLFIEDVARAPEYQEEFVRDTYCESGALSQYAMVSREILTARYSSHFEKEARITTKPARTKKGVARELEQDLLAASISRRPVILVGDVGVGKSMFLRHLIHVEAKEALKRGLVLYVDFVSKPAIAYDLPKYVASEFERQLSEKYGIDVHEAPFVRGVYNKELLSFAKGVYGELRELDPSEFKRKEVAYLADLQADTERHLKACLEHLVRGQARQVVIILDNVDQRETFFQEQVFVMGHAFAEDWPVTVFVALRPDTFAYSRTSGSLSAYQPRVFTIDPPRVDRVIKKRLRYALAKLRETGSLPSFSGSFTLSSAKLEAYIEMLAEAFERNDDLIEMVDNLSNGNLRRALDFVAMFVGSGHVDSEKIFRILNDSGRYVLPHHEFLRAVMYGDNEYYDPKDAPIINVFDVGERDPREHFLVACILSFVERSGTAGGTEGFLPIGEVFRHFQDLGFTERQVEGALRRLLDRDLLGAPRLELKAAPARVRITSAGAYTAKKLAGTFAYVDAVVVDTPILHKSNRALIQDETSIAGRVQRAEYFASYLDACWDPVLLSEYDWPEQSRILKEECAEISRRLPSSH